MDTAFVVVVVVGPAAMALVAVVARAAGTGRLGRNRGIGIRVPSTLASDAAWRAGHRAAVVPAWISVVVLAVADGFAALLAHDGGPTQALLNGLTALLVLALGWVTVAAIRAARAASR